LNLAIDLHTIIDLSKGESLGFIPPKHLIKALSIDTRKLVSGEHTVFYALQGEFKDGHDFIQDAYDKGVRVFIVSNFPKTLLKQATYILVKNTLYALQAIAKHHRDQFNYPIVAITGSVGKTTTKEWLYYFLASKFRVIRSPKSYNSQLGVALSLLELNHDCDIALIEVGISAPGEMERLEKLIRPDIGILTAIGTAHLENFSDAKELCKEKIQLFAHAKNIFLGPGLRNRGWSFLKGDSIELSEYTNEMLELPFSDIASKTATAIAIAVATYLKVPAQNIKKAIPLLPRLAMRLETYEGVNNNTIINDTYNLDLDALKHSLEFQVSIAKNRPRALIIGLHDKNPSILEKIYAIAQPFQLDQIQVVYLSEEPVFTIENSVVLIKGTRKANMQKWAMQLKLKKHKTQIEINLSALRHNLLQYKDLVDKNTKMLVMVKAQAYGSGLIKTAQFIEKIGIDYLGVAYADEGVELRKAGVLLPILVMNAEEEAFDDCIQYKLEPSIYSFEQLEALLHHLIAQNKEGFPIHLKFDTGMNRLGFSSIETRKLIDVIRSQPEILIKSVYSHLAESDNRNDPSFTLRQLETFSQICNDIQKMVPTPFLRHILNSEGIVNFSSSQTTMVRIGIGAFGISSNEIWRKNLRPVIAWKSTISQLKTVEKGESIGYNRSYVAPQKITIAIIPLGYGDGFRRILSNGKGGVFIQGVFCPTVGNVCMDMIMVDVSHLSVQAGAEVEIIGQHQGVEALSSLMETIPYELMTGISQRVYRSYINEE
jgi:Alr-MurF fusion protein